MARSLSNLTDDLEEGIDKINVKIEILSWTLS